VGPGNVPAFVHRSVPDVHEAAIMTIESKAFDHGTACVAEQALVVEEAVADAFQTALEEAGLSMIAAGEQGGLAEILFDGQGRLRPDAVGQSALELSRRLGLRVPPSTRVLGATLTRVGPEEPLSREILGPVLVIYRVRDAGEGWECCRQILAFGGEGPHDCAACNRFGGDRPLLHPPGFPHPRQYPSPLWWDGIQRRT
jgi:acetaldehyde dehydrogenase (acetylating)